ncbi:MAG: carboxypeptidase regulatory-like domain-containing protein, partial [Bacteroidales bacterium]|nr:carboxypeptidase regulatory-like domain-containing protein [Bacteroidales bacterium]
MYKHRDSKGGRKVQYGYQRFFRLLNYHCCLMVIIVLLCIPAVGMASDASARQLVSEGRTFLGKHDIVNANIRFRSAVSEDHSNQVANAFYSVTRILALVYGVDFNVLLDRNNASRDNRDIYHWNVDFPEDADGNTNLPSGAPTSTEYIDFLTESLMPEIDGALLNLTQIDSTFSLLIAPGEINSSEGLEVDYGDVLMYRALLHALKSTIRITASYDLECNVADLLPKVEDDSFSMNDDLLNVYADFLKLLTPDQMSSAGSDLELSVDRYLDASDFIRAEVDDQGDDFITFDSESLEDEQEFRNVLQDVKDSLAGPTMIGDEEFDDHFVLDLSRFFGQPFGLRIFLPDFDADNNVIPCTFPDPTIHDLLPAYTSAKWNNILGLSVHVAGEITSSSTLHGNIMVESFADHWGDEYYLLQSSTTIFSVGEYSLPVQTGSTTWLRAWSDEDGNGILSAGDKIGEPATNPIEVSLEDCTYADRVDINLDKEITGVKGRIVGPSGQPLAGIYVTARVRDDDSGECSWLNLWSTTNDNGIFALNGISAGTP